MQALDAVDDAGEVAGAVVEPAVRFCTISGSGSPSRLVKPGGNTTSAPSLTVEQPARRGGARSPRAASGCTCSRRRGRRRSAARRACGRRALKCWVRQVDEQLPQAQRLGVAALQQHDPLAGALLELVARRRTSPGPACRSRRDRRALSSSAASVSPRSRRCSISMPNGVPQSPMWFSRITSWPRNVSQRGRARRRSPWSAGGRRASPWRRSAPSSRSRCAAVLWCAGTPRRSSAATSTSACGEEAVVERQVDEAGSGDLDGGDAGERRLGGGEHLRRDLTGRPAEPLGERQRTVGLGVGTVARAHHGVGAGPPGSSAPKAGASRSAIVARGSAMARPLCPLAGPTRVLVLGPFLVARATRSGPRNRGAGGQSSSSSRRAPTSMVTSVPAGSSPVGSTLITRSRRGAPTRRASRSRPGRRPRAPPRRRRRGARRCRRPRSPRSPRSAAWLSVPRSSWSSVPPS